MAPRMSLHQILQSILGINAQVYFQPPETIKLKYPCIIYMRDYGDTQFADNLPYKTAKRYKVIVIDENPDSDIPDKVAQLPTCKFDRFYTVDNLNHDVYKLFF